MSTRRRGFLIAAILIVGVIITLIWRLTSVAPAWYAPPPAEDQHVAELADRVEYWLVQEAQQIRPPRDDHWTLRVREEQINAWLSARLPKWLARQNAAHTIEQLGTPQVRFDPDGIRAAVPLGHGLSSRFIVVRFMPVIVDGKLRIELSSVALGRIRLPGEPLANLLATFSRSAPAVMENPAVMDVSDWLNRRENIDPVLKLEDGRRIRLLDLQLSEGILDITAQTLTRNAAVAAP